MLARIRQIGAGMEESQFGFSYTWADLQPIRHLSVTVLAAQVLGAVLGLWLGPHPRWFLNLWFGAAIATFPAFVVGLVLQARVRPGSITENRVMVRRLGLIALLLSIIAVIIPLLPVGREP